MRPPSKLMQKLFELCVVVGMDNDTGLVVSTKNQVCMYILYVCMLNHWLFKLWFADFWGSSTTNVS